MKESKTIACIGEILWDGLPDGLFLGGAPLNVCLNLHELGIDTAMISRVGNDRLGKEAMSRLEARGLDTGKIQVDAEHETGFVSVTLSEDGDPDYEIIQPAAWDFINVESEAIKNWSADYWAIVYGTLAHRINAKLEVLSETGCIKVLDMNLRDPYYDKEKVIKLVSGCDLLKINKDELQLLQEWCALPDSVEKACREITSSFSCGAVCVTLGSEGSVLLYRDEWFEHPGYQVQVGDAVGAGDAFLAALLFGLQKGRSGEELLPFANAAGALVASRSGATPNYTIRHLQSIIREGSVSAE